MMRLPLQWKVLAGYLVVAGVGLGVAGWLALDVFASRDLKQLEAGLTAESRLAGELFTAPLSRVVPDVQEIDMLADRLGEVINARVTVIASDGKVLGDSYESGDALRRMENHLLRPEVRDALLGGVGVSVRLSSTVGIRMLNVAVPVRSAAPDRRLLGVVRLSLPLTQIEEQHRALRQALILALAVAFLLSLVLSFLIARSVTRPLAEMVDAARRMVGGEFHPRLRPRSNDEVADLGRVLNQMAASIEEKIESLKEDRAKMAATLIAMQEGVMVLAPDGTLRLFNPAMERMIGRYGAELTARNYWEVIRQPRLNEFIAQALAGGDGATAEISLGPDPVRTFQIYASCLAEGRDSPAGVVLVFHDITNIRRLEQVRKDFVANVSHELRTPLTAIKGYVEALRDDPKVDLQQRQRFLEIIETHADRLNLIITDLLLLSKIESGQIPMKQEPVDLAPLFDRTLALLSHHIHRKQHKIVLNISPALPSVLGDEERLGQVFLNLLDNAIKYTPDRGTITIAAGEKEGTIEINIEDTGIGIPPKDLPRIFERFYRVDKARSRELGGTGLGLAIVKHLVEAHRGTVLVESSGKGSRFTITLPAAFDMNQATSATQSFG
jgi:two-component system, OmpR family, phosphate regulon sensor histidine kinase PhoR